MICENFLLSIKKSLLKDSFVRFFGFRLYFCFSSAFYSLYQLSSDSCLFRRIKWSLQQSQSIFIKLPKLVRKTNKTIYQLSTICRKPPPFVSVHEHNEITDVTNYRSVAKLSNFSKIFIFILKFFYFSTCHEHLIIQVTTLFMTKCII